MSIAPHCVMQALVPPLLSTEQLESSSLSLVLAPSISDAADDVVRPISDVAEDVGGSVPNVR